MAAGNAELDLREAARQHLEAARNGSPESVGALLEAFRRYLLAVANDEIAAPLRAKAGASDLVQDTFLEAHKQFDRFLGQQPEELRLWLRAILRNKLADFQRQFRGTDKRQVDRERPLDASSAPGQPRPIADRAPSPSAEIAAREVRQALEDLVKRLPEDYQQVIRWRNWEELPFAEIGRRLGRSEDAARMLWARAVERLQREWSRRNESS
jgi:RNA polymerase sigma-70 factor (ECF subfamily)